MTDSVAGKLWRARLSGTLVPRTDLDGIDAVDRAYEELARQTALSERAIVGWKIGAASDASMQTLGFDAPFVGPVLEGFVYDSGATLPVFPTHGPRLETELAIILGADLPRRAQAYDLAEVKPAIASVAPGFEIVALRMEGGAAGHGPWIVADAAGNDAIVLGAPVHNWAARDLRNRSAQVSVSGETVTGSNAELVWDDPCDAVVYLANHPTIGERGLRDGDVVMTGTWAGALPLQPGDTATADFGDIGAVSASFAAATPDG